MYFPEINESDPSNCAEAVYERSTRVTHHTHTRVRQVSPDGFKDETGTVHILSSMSQPQRWNSDKWVLSALGFKRHSRHTLMHEITHYSYFVSHQDVCIFEHCLSLQIHHVLQVYHGYLFKKRWAGGSKKYSRLTLVFCSLCCDIWVLLQKVRRGHIWRGSV